MFLKKIPNEHAQLDLTTIQQKRNDKKFVLIL